LAENVRRCVAIIKKHSPEAKLCIWSDMFDPHHNAGADGVKEHFYLVRGSLGGSWEGLPKETLIVNWNSGQAAKSLPFFAERGHGQVLAGYYDAPPERIKTWLSAAAATKSAESVRGIMYTTWQSNFRDLEKFAAAALGQ
jgi:hypothetical protein